jgi:hypothetical protein
VKEVVEIMCNCSSQHTKTFQALGFVQFIFASILSLLFERALSDINDNAGQ